MSTSFGLVIEMLVAVLLIVTIAYCVILHNKLKWLKSDQAELKTVIRDLNSSTSRAEQTVTALCTVSSGAEKTLQAQIDRTQELTADLARGLAEAEHFLSKINKIVRAADTAPRQKAPPAVAGPVPRPAVRASEVGLGRLNALKRKSQTSGKEVA